VWLYPECPVIYNMYRCFFFAWACESALWSLSVGSFLVSRRFASYSVPVTSLWLSLLQEAIIPVLPYLDDFSVSILFLYMFSNSIPFPVLFQRSSVSHYPCMPQLTVSVRLGENWLIDVRFVYCALLLKVSSICI
jgi:hypothetical protein